MSGRCPACEQIRRARRGQRRNETSTYHHAEHRRFSRAVIARDGCCLVCGTTEQLHAHHVVRKQDGGPDDPSNGVTLCLRHNAEVDAALRRGDRAAAIVQRVALAHALVRAR